MRRVKGVCPFCGDGHVTHLDGTVYGCSRDHYWRNIEGIVDELHRLTVAEASVKMAMLDEGYIDEVEKINKTNIYEDPIIFPPEIVHQITQAKLELVRDGMFMAFMTPEGKVIFALRNKKPHN